jgi:hypothetical protein
MTSVRSAIVEVDVMRLVPEAQPIAARAAAVYLKHTAPWFVGLLAHGSAYKGGYIAGCSDVDFQLYLDPSAFTPAGTLPLPLLVDIHRDLASMDPSPFRYVQCYALPCATPPGQTPPVPGAYTVLAGKLPVAEATSAQLHDAARLALARLEPLTRSLASELTSCGGERLQQKTRLLCTDVWPTLYHIATLQHGDPIAVWNLPKPAAIALLPPETAVGSAIRAFYAAVRDYYPGEATLEGRLAVIACGVEFLSAAQRWWVEQQEL